MLNHLRQNLDHVPPLPHHAELNLPIPVVLPTAAEEDPDADEAVENDSVLEDQAVVQDQVTSRDQAIVQGQTILEDQIMPEDTPIHDGKLVNVDHPLTPDQFSAGINVDSETNLDSKTNPAPQPKAKRGLRANSRTLLSAEAQPPTID